MANNRNSRRSSKAATSAASDNSNALVATSGNKKHKILAMRSVRDTENGHAYIYVKLNGKVVINCKERNEDTGAIVSDSNIELRETSWIGPIMHSEIRAKASVLGIHKLLFFNHNRLDEYVLSSMFNGWFTFSYSPYKAGDAIPGATDGAVYAHDSQNINIVSGACNKADFDEALDVIIRINKK